jgi:hypothetical protein
LYPLDTIVPEQLPPVGLFETIVFRRVAVPLLRRIPPPLVPLSTELLFTVTFVRLAVFPSTQIPPPSEDVEFPLTVTLVRVIVAEPLVE